jgi:DNA gyrase subunit A
MPKPIKIQSAILEQEMRESYLDYAMSVIVSRALPDVRDGLKPVHRRILYAMHTMGLRSSARFRKSATVVGEVIGKYHPHGDAAVYDSMVRMAQDFSMRYPLIKGQGNFGSIDGDPPAAMRYSEAKMARISDYILSDIDKQTVKFTDNFDATKKEPSVLPSRLPNLLINGSLGIAVGMATNILPHNLTEVIDATIAQIKNPNISLDKLTEIIPGPDFPTGGNIYDTEAIKAAYATGRGPVTCRGTAKIIEKKGSGGFQILISEIPYQVNKADLVTKIAALVKARRIERISGIRDESDRKEQVRIIIELKSSAFPRKILNQLYKLTPLQTTLHINSVALVDGIQPRLLPLKDIIAEYIKHRQDVVTKRTQYELRVAKDREHILLGLQKALDFIDQVIDTIRKSNTKEKAHQNLVKKFKLTDKQAEAILEMRLSALAGLERKKVLDELGEKKKLIGKLEKILTNPKRIKRIIIDELTEIREKFGDERRTKIFKNPVGKFDIEDLVPDEPVIVTLTAGDYIKRVPIATYRSQRRGGKGIKGMPTREKDTVKYLIPASTHDDIMFFTNQGKIFRAKVYEIPAASRVAKGHSLANVISLGPDERVTAVLTEPKRKTEGKYLLMATKLGRVKKTLIDAYQNVRQSGITAIRLAPDDKLKFVKITRGHDQIILVSKDGQAIFFRETDVRPMGRSAAGVRGMRLREGDEVIAAEVVKKEANPDLLTVLENGYGKRTIIRNHFKVQKRGGLGVRASKVTEKTGKLIQAIVCENQEGDLALVSKSGAIIRLPIRSVKRLGRSTMGVTLMRFKDKGKNKDVVSSVGLIEKKRPILKQKKIKPAVKPALKKKVEKKIKPKAKKPKVRAFKTKRIISLRTKRKMEIPIKKTAKRTSRFVRKRF